MNMSGPFEQKVVIWYVRYEFDQPIKGNLNRRIAGTPFPLFLAAASLALRSNPHTLLF